MGKILIEGMEFYSYHGCFAEEQIVGNKFIVDVTIDYNIEMAAENDELNETINYQSVFMLVKKEMAIKSKLLENVSKRIADSIKENFPKIQQLTVRVSKVNPPLGGQIKLVAVEYSC